MTRQETKRGGKGMTCSGQLNAPSVIMFVKYVSLSLTRSHSSLALPPTCNIRFIHAERVELIWEWF